MILLHFLTKDVFMCIMLCGCLHCAQMQRKAFFSLSSTARLIASLGTGICDHCTYEQSDSGIEASPPHVY